MSEPICALSDFPESQCGCRLHAPKPAPPTPGGPVVARTTATYPSVCGGGCDKRIDVGAPIVLVDGVWGHEECLT